MHISLNDIIISMKRLSFLIFATILILMPGCILNLGANSVEIISIAPDKGVYQSGDPMELNITLEVSDYIENVTINATGLINKVGKTLLHKSRVVTLTEGINNVTFSYRMPACSSCNKLEPGIYSIEVTVSHNGDIIAQGAEEIELKQ